MDSKPYASLSSGLLARKGGAKPAMRPQGYNGFGGAGFGAGGGGGLEDLGWNDMGPADEYHHPSAAQLGLTPARGHHAHPAEDEQDGSFHDHDDRPEAPAFVPGALVPQAFEPAEAPPEPAAPPPVVEQQRVLRRSFAQPESVTLPRRRAAPSDVKAKAAFTLRLDPERHLKLRLASAVTRQSAQHLVTAALDDFLDKVPGLDALAERVPAETGQHQG
ncbi:MAG TPA: hypothetical protein VFW19_04075 [Allosphingosinicella sp.]|nr:hypothetical protein [Allosphingosinicella sp.]